MDEYTIIRAKQLIDGTGNKPIKNPVVVIRGETILDVGTEDDVCIPTGDNVKEINLEDQTILPGLVDSHVHLTLGTYGGYSEIVQESDAVHLMSGVANAKQALHTGITTMMDAGARNMVAHELRDGINMGLVEGPRLLVAGRPLTITGGHFHFCNDNECDGVDQVRHRIRQFVKEGADMVKIMASGGGSAFSGSLGGPTGSMPAFRLDELTAAVVESHKFERVTTAHCEAYESIMNAAMAGVDIICHCGFYHKDGTRGYDPEAVKIMAERGLYYNPTIQTGSERYDTLTAKKQSGAELTEAEKKAMEGQEYKIGRKSDNLRKMIKAGVQIVAGSDATGIGNSTQLFRSLEIMVDAGMSPMDVIVSATSNAAKAVKMEKVFGSIQKGLQADIIAVKGDPLKDITLLRSLGLCMQAGRIVRGPQ